MSVGGAGRVSEEIQPHPAHHQQRWLPKDRERRWRSLYRRTVAKGVKNGWAPAMGIDEEGIDSRTLRKTARRHCPNGKVVVEVQEESWR